MDSITQVVLGAAVGEATLGKKVGNKAILWGAIAGTIPDLDVFTRLFVDEITALELHRGISHSLIFSILFAPFLGYIISKIHKKEIVNWRDWSLLSFLSLVTHPLLDCHTTYGTQFLWPFEYRVAYNNIFVADPIYTVPFLICTIVVLFINRNNKWRSRINWIGIGISSSYMVLTIFFKFITFTKFESSLEKQKIEYIELDTQPTPFNSILWVAHVETKDSILIGYYSLFDKSEDIEFVRIAKNRYLINEVKDKKRIKKLIKFSKNWWFIRQEKDMLLFSDARFGQANKNGKHNFVYTFKLWHDNEGVFYVKQAPRTMDGAKKMLSELIHRIFNEK